ncbi:MAG: aldehyde dehydrogenase family protein [Chloroflexi bacterium]|nr:aldehyde dehydrogenase family protein [Chloroflexota bacterium]
MRMHTGGRTWQEHPTRTYQVFRPGNGQVLADVQDTTAEELDLVIEDAVRAGRAWAALAVTERAALLDAFADAVDAAADELARLDARNGGHPIRWTRFGAHKGAETLRYFAGLGLENGGRSIPATPDHLHVTVREPYGVVGVITAFNHPTMFATARTAAALIAGNAVVVKPAEQTPLSALRLAEIAAQHLPPGVFAVVPGRAETGRALVQHPHVPRINFTGSTATALRIQGDAAASGRLKRLGFQLSGKNPLVIMPDVPVEEAVEAAVEGMNLYKVMGQSCGSTSVAFVPRAMAAAFREALAERLGGLVPADPEDETTTIGALVTAAHRSRVEGLVAEARQAGATVLAGGRRPGEPSLGDGFYYLPTALADLPASADILRTEVFGPVLSIMTWESEDELLSMVNAPAYGLTAAIYTHDLDAALRMARAIEAGYVWVNDVEKRWIGVPFGGHKDSGTSTEFSADELAANSQIKAINIRIRG